jgi:hypothetical protein
MSQPNQRTEPSTELNRAKVLDDPRPRCWYCVRPGAEGTVALGAGPGGAVGTRVPICSDGVGCRDGKIYHGPLAAPHHRDDSCDYCGPVGSASRSAIIAEFDERASRRARRGAGNRGDNRAR